MSSTTHRSQVSESVEADKKSILRKALRTNFMKFPGFNSQSKSENMKDDTEEGDTLFPEDWETLIKNSEIDDSEDIFNDFLKKTKEAYEREKEFKKKNPYFKSILDENQIFKMPRKRKRKSKALEDALEVMNDYKKKMIELEALKTNSIMNTVSTRQNISILQNASSNITTQNTNTRKNFNISQTISTNQNFNNEQTQSRRQNLSTMQNGNRKLNFNTIKSLASLVDVSTRPNLSIRDDFSTAPNISSRENFRFGQNVNKNLNFTKLNSDSTRDNFNARQTTTRKILTSTIRPSQLQKSVKIYPSWKHSATYTPIFPQQLNPKWANLNKIAEPTRPFYTPGHINSWMSNAIDIGNTRISSCKSIKSDGAICNSVFNNEDKDSPPRIAIDSITTKRSTVVRFKPSPPEHIPCSYSDGASISSGSLLGEEIEANQANLERIGISPKNYDNNINYNFSDSENQLYEENLNHHEEYQERYDTNMRNISPDIQGNNSAKPPQLVEDFIRKLNYNISNNYNMEVKCSMKLKYFKS